MTLLDFMYYLTYLEYEKAKLCIFKDYFPTEHKVPIGNTKNETVRAAFHPIFLSSLLNQ